jgi:sterol 3beta-glucosyltransferase
MPSEHDSKERVRRKLTKKRKPQRHPSVQYPERLKEGEDAQEDVTAAKGQPAQYANQSVFSMIAAAGSKVDFNSRFDDESSDSDYEPETATSGIKKHASTIPSSEHTASQHEDHVNKAAQHRHKQKSHEHGLLRSLPKLNLRTIKEKNYMSQSSLPLSSERSASTESQRGVTPRDAPVMSRMLEAEAQLGTSTELTVSEKESSQELKNVQLGASKSSLVIRLKEIFGFVTAEEVISGLLSMTIVIYQLADKILEYPCWLLQSVLLQGYMYITQHHICFYAYLPKKSVSHRPCMQIFQAHDLQELDRKVRIPRQKRETEPQIQSLLVHS